MQRAARALARETRMPGFRKGKAPPSLVIQRLGFGSVLEQAIHDALPQWYEGALLASGVSPVGDPSIEIVSTPQEEGEPLTFKFELGVLPRAKLGPYKGLEVGRAEVEVPAEAVEREVEHARRGFARLEPVERQAGPEDVLLIDFEGTIDGTAFEGSKTTDYLLELDSDRLIEGFGEQLLGAKAGEQRQFEITLTDQHRAEQLAGKRARFTVEVKEVRERVLPELDDDFAAEASQFDTLEELRADIRARLGEAVTQRIQEDFRVAAIDAVLAKATVEVPDELARARASERWERLERGLSARGVNPQTYLRMQGRTREEVIEESITDAELELKREAVLAAVAEAEAMEVSEEEMLEALAHSAEHERVAPAKLLARLREEGRDKVVGEEIRVRKALDLLVDSAKPIPIERAEAREKIWTPEKERDAAGALWTPGSE